MWGWGQESANRDPERNERAGVASHSYEARPLQSKYLCALASALLPEERFRLFLRALSFFFFFLLTAQPSLACLVSVAVIFQRLKGASIDSLDLRGTLARLPRLFNNHAIL